MIRGTQRVIHINIVTKSKVLAGARTQDEMLIVELLLLICARACLAVIAFLTITPEITTIIIAVVVVIACIIKRTRATRKRESDPEIDNPLVATASCDEGRSRSICKF